MEIIDDWGFAKLLKSKNQRRTFWRRLISLFKGKGYV
jgi:hypothetical protein